MPELPNIRPTPELLDLCRTVVGWARDGEQVEALATRSSSTSVRVYRGAVESFTSAAPYGVGVRVIVDGRQGFASAGSLDESVVREALDEARDNARFAQPDEHAGLAEPDGLPRPPMEGLYSTEAASMSAEDKVATALDLERRTLALDPRVRVRNASWSDSIGEAALASTTGVESHAQRSQCSVSVGAMADEGGGRSQTSGGVSFGRSPSALDLDFAADEAVSETVRMLGASKPRSAKVVAVLMPQVALSFLRVIGRMLSGDAVLKGRSPFAGRIDEEVAVAALTLVDDPTDVESMAASPDDDEGVTSRRNVLIDAGVLRMFLYDTHTARRAGAASTASAVRSYASTPSVGARAMALVPGTLSQDDVLKAVGEGVLVQSVTGMHSGVSPVSGDFSVGAAGLMIRGGVLAEPVQEMTIGSTLQRMLLDVAHVGGDLRWFGGSAAPTLAIRDVSLGGT